MVVYVTTTISGLKVTINTSIESQAVLYISSKQDHGLGAGVNTNYPYFVERIYPEIGVSTITRSYTEGNYIIELIASGATLDSTMFDLTPSLPEEKYIPLLLLLIVLYFILKE